MDEFDKLKEIYYNPETGFSSGKALVVAAKSAGLKLTVKDILSWYKDQAITQQTTTKKKSELPSIPFAAKSVGRIVADLIDMSTLSRHNGCNKWILTAIDVYSRRAWAFPLKNKTPNLIKPHLQTVFNRISKDYPKAKLSLTVDTGSEFKGPVNTWAHESNITIFRGKPGDGTKTRTALSESFNRTLLRMLYKFMNSAGKSHWVDHLDKFINNYNKRINSGIKAVPMKVYDGTEEPTFREINDKLKIGDYVRIANTAGKFTKTTRELTYGDEVYRILTRDKARYILIDRKGKIVDPPYLPRMLLKVPKPAKESISQSVPLPPRTELLEAKKTKKLVRLHRKAGLENVDTETAEVKIPKRLIPKANVRTVKEPTPTLLRGVQDKLVGKRITVYWSKYKRWYPGTVTKYDITRKEHVVLYDDELERAKKDPSHDPEIYEKLVGKGKARFKIL